MKKNKILLFAFFLFFVINSCNSSPTSPIENIPISTDDYHQIIITQTDYQSFDISNGDKLILSSKKVSTIVLGNKNSGIFVGKDTSIAVYETSGNNFRLKFNFHQVVDDTVLNYEFIVRYVFSDNQYYDLDTFKVTYKYPYYSTEIFAEFSKILEPTILDIQSFDILDSIIYYHPFGPYGMYEYNMRTSQTSLKVDYSGGDYLTAAQNYVFCDVYHFLIYRYNLTSDSTDIILDLSPYLQNSIVGMDVYENKLYVSTDKWKIIILDLDLQIVGMIPYAQFGLALTIKDDIAYSNNYRQIIRYNIKTNSYMESVPLPTSECNALTVIGNKMFFTDDSKKIIGCFNLSDL